MQFIPPCSLYFFPGMQHGVILEGEPWGLPLTEKLLPQYLKEAGYATHAIGKWHLGFFREVYTPTFRGFDSHYGYWQGLQDYYDHSCKATVRKHSPQGRIQESRILTREGRGSNTKGEKLSSRGRMGGRTPSPPKYGPDSPPPSRFGMESRLRSKSSA